MAPELASTPANSSNHAAQATPKGLRSMICALTVVGGITALHKKAVSFGFAVAFGGV